MNAAPPSTPVPFAATLRSEWTKLASLRSTKVTLGLAVILGIGLTAIASLGVGATWDDWSAADRREFNPISYVFLGSFFSAILIVVFSVKAVSSEYASETMRVTLTATPRRGRVLAAKALIVAIVSLVVGAVAVLGMFVVGQAVLGAFGAASASLGDERAVRVLVGSSLTGPLFPIISVAFAFVLRSAAGAITSVLALIFAPAIFGGLLPDWWQENLLAYLPGPAGDSLALGRIEEAGLMYAEPGLAGVAVAAWLAAFLALAYVALVKRDA